MHGCPAPCREYVLNKHLRNQICIPDLKRWVLGSECLGSLRLKSHPEIQRKGFQGRDVALHPKQHIASRAPSLPRRQRKLGWSQANLAPSPPQTHNALSAVFSILSFPYSPQWAVNPRGGRVEVKLIPSPPLCSLASYSPRLSISTYCREAGVQS